MDQGRGHLPHQIWNFLSEQWGFAPRNFGVHLGMIPLGQETAVPQAYYQAHQGRSHRYSGPPSLNLVWSLDNRSVGLKRTEEGHCSDNLVLMTLLSNDVG